MNEFLIDKREVRRAFSRAANSYDATAVLQREVCSRMLERLDYIKLQPRRVLDAGGGTGWGARQLGERYAQAEILALDIAIGMLQVARGTSSWWQKLFSGRRQHFVCADVEALPLAAQSVDMVWSNLFSTFGPDTLQELRIAFDGVDGYNHVNRFIDMHDIGDMLMTAGFADPVMEMEKLTLTYDDVKAVMQDLRGIGAHNATAGRAQGMTGRQKWTRIVQNYEVLRRNGKLPATFEVIYGHAWKVPSKQATDGRAIVQTKFRL